MRVPPGDVNYCRSYKVGNRRTTLKDLDRQVGVDDLSDDVCFFWAQQCTPYRSTVHTLSQATIPSVIPWIIQSIRHSVDAVSRSFGRSFGPSFRKIRSLGRSPGQPISRISRSSSRFIIWSFGHSISPSFGRSFVRVIQSVRHVRGRSLRPSAAVVHSAASIIHGQWGAKSAVAGRCLRHSVRTLSRTRRRPIRHTDRTK